MDELPLIDKISLEMDIKKVAYLVSYLNLNEAINLIN